MHKHNIGRSHIKISSTGELISFSPMAQAVRRIVGTMSTFTRLHRGCLFHTTIFGLHGSSHIVCLDPTDKNVILTEPPRGTVIDATLVLLIFYYDLYIKYLQQSSHRLQHLSMKVIKHVYQLYCYTFKTLFQYFYIY